MHHHDAHEHKRALLLACEAVMQTYELIGLPVNVGPKKTALITVLKGGGSFAVRKTLINDTGDMVLSIPGYDIPMVREY
eukprot:1126002-Prorocentrum_lima.AAC.1